MRVFSRALALTLACTMLPPSLAAAPNSGPMRMELEQLGGDLDGVAPQLRVPSFLADSMVLQRNGAALWGWAAPSASVIVTVVALDGSTLARGQAAASSADGRWEASVVLGAQASTTVRITAGAEALELHDVAWGDVFICGGQSNMEYPMADVFNGTAEREASSFPNLRMLNFVDVATEAPQTDCESKAPYIWAASKPSTISPRSAATDPDKGGFATKFPSAVCWFAARDLLRADPATPIGIITAAKSGSSIECWMPPAAMRDGIPTSLGGNGTCGGTLPCKGGAGTCGGSGVGDGDGGDGGEAPPACPAGGISDKQGRWFNGMIAPLLPMRLTAVLWCVPLKNAVMFIGWAFFSRLCQARHTYDAHP